MYSIPFIEKIFVPIKKIILIMDFCNCFKSALGWILTCASHYFYKMITAVKFLVKGGKKITQKHAHLDPRWRNTQDSYFFFIFISFLSALGQAIPKNYWDIPWKDQQRSSQEEEFGLVDFLKCRIYLINDCFTKL